MVRACEQPADFKLLYDVKLSIEEKIEAIVKDVSGLALSFISDFGRLSLSLSIIVCDFFLVFFSRKIEEMVVQTGEAYDILTVSKQVNHVRS